MTDFIQRKIFSHFPIFIYRISGDSMTPNYRNKQIILAVRYWFVLSKNDVIIVTHPQTKRLLIKRIKRVRNFDRKEYFVLGDNEEASTDSRDFGWITEKMIVAKVVKNY